MGKSLSIFSCVDVKNKDELFKFISKEAYELKIVKNKIDFYNSLIEREKVGSTGLENHIAIPHAISEKIFKQHIFVISLKNEIKYETLDGTKIKSVICLAVPKNKENFHIDVLQKVSTMLLEKNNQDTLNKGIKKDIQFLFEKIDNQEFKKENEEIIINDNLSEAENLILLKKNLKKEYKNNFNQEIFKKINNINLNIKNCKLEINDLRKELIKKNKIDLKKEYKENIKKINKKISEENKITKNKLFRLAKDNKEKVKEIKNNLSKSDYKKEIINHNINLYNEKANITKHLNELNLKKENIIKEYKDNINNNKSFYIEKMNVKKLQITNPKNYFIKYINNIQTILMIIMFVIALWAIVLGTFGISTNSSFLIENVRSLIPDIIQEQNDITSYNNAFDIWNKIAVSDNYELSLSTLIFGVISIILLIPLKFFKLSNIYWEKYSKTFFSISIIILVTLSIITIISFENVNKYISFQENANKINESFAALNIIKRPIKNINEFASQAQYDSYITNLKNEFYKWTNVKLDNIQEWQNMALAEIKKICKTNFDQIINNQIYKLFL